MSFEMYPKWIEGHIVNTADEEEALLLKLHPKLAEGETDKPEDPDADESDGDNTADEEEANTAPVRRGRKPRA